LSIVQFIYTLAQPIFKIMLKKVFLPASVAFLFILSVSSAQAQGRRKGSPGQPFEVQITPYRTTMTADGRVLLVLDLKELLS